MILLVNLFMLSTIDPEIYVSTDLQFYPNMNRPNLFKHGGAPLEINSLPFNIFAGKACRNLDRFMKNFRPKGKVVNLNEVILQKSVISSFQKNLLWLVIKNKWKKIQKLDLSCLSLSLHSSCFKRSTAENCGRGYSFFKKGGV